VADQDAEPSASLAEDALHLATTLEHLLPDHSEVLGLNSLLRYCEARRHARFDAVGNFVPLALQQTGDWNVPLIDSAELRLKRAARYQSPGPMQLEAAIQSAHCSRRTTGTTPWDMIAAMYAALCRQWPSVGAHVGAAVAEAECGRIQHAAHLLDMLDPADVANYPPFWAARGHILALQGQVDEAARAFVRAAGLTESTPVRAYLMHRSSAAAHPKTSQS
jgi:RNA polymerase sigma-70 factor (ECF subfamily)